MTRHAALLALVASVAGLSSTAAIAQGRSLPGVKAGENNGVPGCATPGRLLSFIKARNSDLEQRFAKVPVAYMRHGEQLGVRWDYAFFQMILETGTLSFERGNGKPGLVRSSQNNFAGLGATGRGERGESFPDIDSGVKAHLQHLLMYTGERIADPVADRTAKVQEWGVLTSWQKRFQRPIGFGDIAAKWAPGSRNYGRDIGEIAGQFYDTTCKAADPHPEMVAEARGGRQATTAVAKADTAGGDKVSGRELMRQSVERARANGEDKLSALGAGASANAMPAQPQGSLSGIRIINSAPATDTAAQSAPAAQAPAQAGEQQQTPAMKMAAAAATVKPSAGRAVTGKAEAKVQAGKCRVWTASYGGAKSVIIRSAAGDLTNFTVLDVNDGQETRETDAYIAAYAKGGAKIAEFPSQTAALSKAFQLCPEG